QAGRRRPLPTERTLERDSSGGSLLARRTLGNCVTHSRSVQSNLTRSLRSLSDTLLICTLKWAWLGAAAGVRGSGHATRGAALARARRRDRSRRSKRCEFWAHFASVGDEAVISGSRTRDRDCTHSHR